MLCWHATESRHGPWDALQRASGPLFVISSDKHSHTLHINKIDAFPFPSSETLSPSQEHQQSVQKKKQKNPQLSRPCVTNRSIRERQAEKCHPARTFYQKVEQAGWTTAPHKACAKMVNLWLVSFLPGLTAEKQPSGGVKKTEHAERVCCAWIFTLQTVPFMRVWNWEGQLER